VGCVCVRLVCECTHIPAHNHYTHTCLSIRISTHIPTHILRDEPMYAHTHTCMCVCVCSCVFLCLVSAHKRLLPDLFPNSMSLLPCCAAAVLCVCAVCARCSLRVCAVWRLPGSGSPCAVCVRGSTVSLEFVRCWQKKSNYARAEEACRIPSADAGRAGEWIRRAHWARVPEHSGARTLGRGSE